MAWGLGIRPSSNRLDTTAVQTAVLNAMKEEWQMILNMERRASSAGVANPTYTTRPRGDDQCRDGELAAERQLAQLPEGIHRGRRVCTNGGCCQKIGKSRPRLPFDLSCAANRSIEKKITDNTEVQNIM